MPKLTPIRHKILKTLVQSGYFLTTSEIANKSNISWNTAESYLKRFHKRGWVKRKTAGRTAYWKANV